MTQPAPASERSLGESVGPGLGAGMVAAGRGGGSAPGLRVRIGVEPVHARARWGQ